MIVTRQNPLDEIQKGFEVLNAIMNSTQANRDQDRAFEPAVNTKQSSDGYFVEVDLPGVKKDDIEIVTEDNVLTITGKREFSQELKEEDYYKVESSYGSFKRSFSLPEDADVQKIEAKSEDGVLYIKIPKKADITKSKKIKIK